VQARYGAYKAVMAEFAPCPAVLFGHHRGDVRENVISNLMRVSTDAWFAHLIS
jgi:tRNA(Ile)-lysidine synthase TilS/MesJ